MTQSKLGAHPGLVSPQGTRYVYLVLLLLLTATAYWASVGFDFVWDDLPLVVDNELLRDPQGPFKMFFRNFWDVGGRNDTFRHFYRPIVTLSYWLNAKLGGYSPANFHATNVALHLACVAMAYGLLLQLLGRPVLAFLAAAFFALHPTHVENVTWISGRTDLLAGFFGLLALTFWRRYDEGHGAWLLPATLSFLLALLSKEVALGFPVAWLLWPLKPGGAWLQGGRRRWKGLAWAAFAVGLYAALRLNVLGVLASNVVFPGWQVFVPALGWVLFSYLRLALFGFGLDPHYSDVQFAFMQGATAWVGLGLLLAVAGGSLFLLRRGGQAARATALTWIFVVPVLSLGSFGDVLYADRFLYLPSLGLGLALGQLAEKLVGRLRGPWARQEQVLLMAGGVLCLGMLWQTVRTSLVWRDNVSLFEQAAKSSPDSVLVWNNLCLAYSYQARFWEAEQAGRKALAIDPLHGYSMHNLGVALRKQGRPSDALPYLRRAVEREPLDSLFVYNLAETLAALGRSAEAKAWYRRVLTLDPDNQAAKHNLGYLYLAEGRLSDAKRWLELAAEEGRHPIALNSLGLLAIQEGRWKDARRNFSAALALDPGLESAKRNLQRLDQERR